ncbi:MAG: ATP-binding cassette domain-containing protein [Gammaproteobacteria bacterium]|nr:ATP-binding cassette domain-containing protein [Gammaproteobacteria bacterium]
MTEPIMMQAEGVCRNYGNQPVLNDICFTANKGEVAGFLGPNGAGKSTLMQIISGTLSASSGEVLIAGHNIQTSPIQARTYLGYLPDRPPLYTDCEVDEYLQYCATIHGVPAASQSDAIETAKLKCGLQEAGRRLIFGLSKGYQQRVGLAQAIIHSPEIIILDEPSSGLDPNQMVEMRELISDLKADHCVIFSTHLLSEAYQLCDRIMIIYKGEIALDRPASSFTSESDLEQTFVSSTGHSHHDI